MMLTTYSKLQILLRGFFSVTQFVKAVHEWYGLGTALELYALWSVGYINDPDEAFGGFDT